MAINVKQLESVLRYNLLPMVDGFYSEDAVTLLMLTASVESDMGYNLFFQNGATGGARGIMQVEAATMFDNYENHLNFPKNAKQREQIKDVCGVSEPNVDALEFNLAFNVMMARVKYWRVPSAIPETLEGKAKYYEEHYNTRNNYASKPDWQVALAKYKHYCM